MVISQANCRIEYLSEVANGSVHDYKLLKRHFKPSMDWFKDFEVELDLGFQGFVKDYVCKKVLIPHKRKRSGKNKPKQELTELQKIENKRMARTRVRVEHSIGGMKRFRILANRCRLKKKKQFNLVLGICAALWNLKIDLKK